MKSFISNEGWTFVQHPRTSSLFDLKSREILKTEEWYVYECPIAHSPGLTRQVFFVDIRDRSAWVTLAQCRTETEALETLQKLKSGVTPKPI